MKYIKEEAIKNITIADIKVLKQYYNKDRNRLILNNKNNNMEIKFKSTRIQQILIATIAVLLIWLWVVVVL